GRKVTSLAILATMTEVPEMPADRARRARGSRLRLPRARGRGAGSAVQRLRVLVDPVEGALDGLLPQAEVALAGLLVHRGLPALVLGPVVDDVLLAVPEADGDAGRVGGAERGRLDDLRAHHGHA